MSCFPQFVTDPDRQPSDAASPATPASGSAGARLRPPSIEEMNAALPQFDFVELIGAGGMGAVYKARQPKLNRFVAIKMLPPRSGDDLPGFSERFEREAQSMARLNHPHIVSVYDFGETAFGQSYFVMEYVEGADLERLIAGGQLTLDHFYGWIPQICEAIQYAHDRGIVHRDIKPANVLIDLEGRVKIADFGLAKLTGADKPETELTQENLSMGTPDYASPEQIDGGGQVDWRSDIYSLGVLMYQMLTGRLPRGAFPLPSEKEPGLDPRLDEVVMRAMQSDPANRFQQASEISDRLTKIRTTPIPAPKAAPKVAPGKPGRPHPHPHPHPHPRPNRSGALPWVVGIMGVSLLAGIALAVVRHRSEGNSSGQTQGTKIASVTEKPATPQKATKPKPAPERAEAPPRDFTRRPEGKDGNAKPPMEAFHDKLGTRAPFSERLEKMRRKQANLTVLSKDGAAVDSELADLPKSLMPVVDFAVGQSPSQAAKASPPFAIALQFDGRIRIWGDKTGALEPIPSAAMGATTAIAAGARHALALRRDGTVVAWGDNGAGQCDVPGDLAEVTAIAAGADFSLALKADGTVAGWGASPGKDVPAGLANVKAITCGFGHALALKADGDVAAWGVNRMGQTDVPEITNAIGIAATYGNSFALLKDGGVRGWGASGPDVAPPGKEIEEIYGMGEALIARDREGRLILHLPGAQKPIAAPGLLRQLPREMKVVVSERLIFAYPPAELREPSATPEPEPEPEPAPMPPAPAPSPQPPTLTEAGQQIEDLKDKFHQAYLEQVSKPYEESLRQLNAFYLNHLEERQTAAAAASKLEEAVAWRGEAERVRDGEPLPVADDPSLPAALIELRHTYREKAGQYEATRKTAEAGLLTKYIDALQAMQDRFTQEQKLDAALEVKAFREEQVQKGE